jgi:C-terminal processing protease CtpA/Prc
MNRLSHISAVVLLLALAGCGSSHRADCSVNAEKQFVLDLTPEWYLFLDLLPASINPDDYSSADDLLDALTAEARAQGKDRYFSFLTSAAGEDSFFGEGQVIGFGLRTLQRSEQLFIAAVNAGSPAEASEFVRGDEILAIGTTPQNQQPVSELNAQPGGVSAAFGPSEAGVTRSFRVRTPGGQIVDRTISKQLITLDPVPLTSTLPRSGLAPVGYIAFDTFIAPAESQLRDAFAAFKAQDVRDLIVDLRYNGGGLVDVAELLANLLAADRAGEVLFTTELNALHADENETVLFATQPQSVAALRIAFITTGASASASELVINSLEPYAQVAIIGSRTYGKPVGQFGFRLAGCDTALRLVAFRDVNRDGEGDFYDGLPDEQFDGAFCGADDDLGAARDDLAEDSTATALAWINQGVCPAAGKSLQPATYYPAPRRPSAAQTQLPGFF